MMHCHKKKLLIIIGISSLYNSTINAYTISNETLNSLKATGNTFKNLGQNISKLGKSFYWDLPVSIGKTSAHFAQQIPERFISRETMNKVPYAIGGYAPILASYYMAKNIYLPEQSLMEILKENITNEIESGHLNPNDSTLITVIQDISHAKKIASIYVIHSLLELISIKINDTLKLSIKEPSSSSSSSSSRTYRSSSINDKIKNYVQLIVTIYDQYSSYLHQIGLLEPIQLITYLVSTKSAIKTLRDVNESDTLDTAKILNAIEKLKNSWANSILLGFSNTLHNKVWTPLSDWLTGNSSDDDKREYDTNGKGKEKK